MPRIRTKHNHPFIQALFDAHGISEIKELAELLGLPCSTVRALADLGPAPKRLPHARTLQKVAQALSMSEREVVARLLGFESQAS